MSFVSDAFWVLTHVFRKHSPHFTRHTLWTDALANRLKRVCDCECRPVFLCVMETSPPDSLIMVADWESAAEGWWSHQAEEAAKSRPGVSPTPSPSSRAAVLLQTVRKCLAVCLLPVSTTRSSQMHAHAVWHQWREFCQRYCTSWRWECYIQMILYHSALRETHFAFDWHDCLAASLSAIWSLIVDT